MPEGMNIPTGQRKANAWCKKGRCSLTAGSQMAPEVIDKVLAEDLNTPVFLAYSKGVIKKKASKCWLGSQKL